MKKLDVMVQGMMIAPAIMFFVLALVHPGFLMYILLIQLVLGPYQLLSAIIRLIMRTRVQAKAKKLLIYYWVAAIISLIAIGLGKPLLDAVSMVWIIILVASPWCIAGFYFYISWIDTYGKPEVRSKFLPNIHI